MKLIVTLLILLQLCCFSLSDNVLPASYATVIQDTIPQPSGATYCSTTDSLFMICGSDSCNSIYELDLEGNFLRKWEYSHYQNGVQAVACDDLNQELHMAEENNMRITTFMLPKIGDSSTFTGDENGTPKLIEKKRAIVDLSPLEKDNFKIASGLQGLTFDPNNEMIITANEKNPRLIIHLSPSTGKIEHITNHIQYSHDISGLAYDNEMDLLWILSAQSKRVYLTDVEGREVYDSWDLPMENPEGIAINNNVSPPEMYIVTSPTSHGNDYVGALFKFTKPEKGSGLSYQKDKVNEENQCDGCDEVYHQARKEGRNMTLILSLSITPISVVLLFGVLNIVICSIICCCCCKRKSREFDEESQMLPTKTLDIEQNDVANIPSGGFFAYMKKSESTEIPLLTPEGDVLHL